MPPKPVNKVGVPCKGFDTSKSFKTSVASLPRLRELLDAGLLTDPRIQLKLPPPSAKAGQSLAYCREVIRKLLMQGPTVYKVGITGHPVFRFYKRPTRLSPSAGYFYERDNYQSMWLLYATATWDEAALMEAVLIESLLHQPGCRNLHPGGEGRQVFSGPYFCYIVHKSALLPPKPPRPN